MIFVGDGDDLTTIKKHAKDNGLAKKCIFTGAVMDAVDEAEKKIPGCPLIKDSPLLISRFLFLCSIVNLFIEHSLCLCNYCGNNRIACYVDSCSHHVAKRIDAH